MKKLLLILPMSVLMTCAWAQNPDMDKKMSNTNSIDGRSFKITLSTNGTSMNEHSSGAVTPADRTATSPAKETTSDQTQSGKTDNPDQNPNYDSQNKSKEKESMANKTTIIRFENGSIESSFMSMKNMDKCPYTVSKTDNEVISFNATCKKNETGSNTSSTGTVTAENCTWVGTVDGKNISGTVNIIKSDGRNKSFTFNGTEVDGTKDLGLK